LASDPIRLSDSIQFGGDFDLDLRTYKLRRAGRILKLERIPIELLLLLFEGRGQLVTREQIIERIWGKDVFLDTDNSINAAILKIRRALKDDPEQPRFVQTITGRGYRFIAEVIDGRCEVSGADTARDRQNAPCGAGGEWPRRAVSRGHAFCFAFRAKRSCLDRFHDCAEVGDPGDVWARAARIAQGESPRFITRTHAASAGQF